MAIGTRKRVKVGGKEPKKEMEIILHDSRFCIEVNPEVHDDFDYKKIRDLVRGLGKNIYIDKTYVCYEGTRWKDAFINEENWYMLLELIRKTDYGNNCTERELREINECLMAIGLTYMYKLLEKYGYKPENIELSYIVDSFTAEYIESSRTTWDW